ncbi:MAG TPA: hypothetical protein PLB94_04265 [Microbacteriaceae bacterium]|nr:hypothetical protein [Microbacteriaceae bacterium]HQZ48405.1 hypothetical protein [Microbacteriaceae bacterium]
MTRKPQRRTSAIVAAAVVAIVAIVGGFVAWSFISRPSGAAETAGAYLAALERGDGVAASALSAPQAAGETAVEFGALDDATEWISAARVETITEAGTDATATATFTLAATQHSVTMTLSNRSGAWLVTDAPATTLRATSTMGAGIEIGDVAVPFDDAAAAGADAATAAGTGTETETKAATHAATVALLPGVYEVTAAPAGLLEGAQEVVATGAESLNVALQPTLGAAALTAADAQLATYLAACTAPATAVPLDCGIRVPWAADLASLTRLTFRIDKAPTLALAPDGSGFAATGGTLVATAVGVDDGGGAASFTYRDSEWALRGSVGFTIDALTLEVW